MTNDKSYTSFREIILLWPSAADLAKDMGKAVDSDMVRAWKMRDNIPSTWWNMLVYAARKRAITGITRKALCDLAEEMGLARLQKPGVSPGERYFHRVTP